MGIQCLQRQLWREPIMAQLPQRHHSETAIMFFSCTVTSGGRVDVSGGPHSSIRPNMVGATSCQPAARPAWILSGQVHHPSDNNFIYAGRMAASKWPARLRADVAQVGGMCRSCTCMPPFQQNMIVDGFLYDVLPGQHQCQHLRQHVAYRSAMEVAEAWQLTLVCSALLELVCAIIYAPLRRARVKLGSPAANYF